MNFDHITSLKSPAAFWPMAGVMVLLAVFCADGFYVQTVHCEGWALGFELLFI
jgi:Mg2+ and Co2+ transporter CorA